ncbi:uncharacterized protein N7483_002219 [Penicillium malachiteum]|uniref:uncharacterized protein n=1 Tax=Penicillium malachiteum TaxID=1324776 RepID=UPI00254888CA|nr:uncharacterized protein N7483_002219 [Penicillium malachiteum]KAJ5737094.1 hypothetical protein N7483_002219 [Penicillium malachiteum]
MLGRLGIVRPMNLIEIHLAIYEHRSDASDGLPPAAIWLVCPNGLVTFCLRADESLDATIWDLRVGPGGEFWIHMHSCTSAKSKLNTSLI